MNEAQKLFFKKSLEKKRKFPKHKKEELMCHIELLNYEEGSYIYEEDEQFIINIRGRGEGLLEIAVLADIADKTVNSAPFVVVVDEIEKGYDRLVYLTRNFGYNVQKFPKNRLGSILDVPESSTQNKQLQYYLNHLKSLGYQFDENILKAFSIDVSNPENPKYFITQIDSNFFLNGEEVFDGATLGEWQQFRHLKHFTDKLRTNKYRLKL